jgi:hypothetical protein
VKGVIVLAIVAVAMTVPAAGRAVRPNPTCTYKAHGLDIYLRLSGPGATPAACSWFNRALKGTVWRGSIPGTISGVWVARGAWRARLTVYAVDPQLGGLYCNRVEGDLASDFTRIR